MDAVWGVVLSVVALLAPLLGVRGERTVEQVRQGNANECRRLGLADQCSAFDGRRIASAHVTEYENTWTHRALTLQRQLDDNVPLARSLLPHTHNSFNASVYSPTVTNQDPNQVYSIADQLRMDIRAIEMDVHWVPSPHGNFKSGYKAVVLCHGEVINGVHVGCSVDRWFPDGLDELAGWLHQPQNANEVVLLYLENNLDNDPKAHEIAAREIAAHLGNLVAKPPANHPCAPNDTSTSAAAVRAAGHRVIIVGNCGPSGSAWNSWVHDRGIPNQWVESSSGMGNDYPGLNGCAPERVRTGAGHALVRWYEDSTWLSAMSSGTSSQLTAVEAAAMAKCGVSLIGFDQLEPTDPRLSAIVWSWAVNAPAAPTGVATCAASTGDTRFHDQGCAAAHAFACSTGPDNWTVTAATGPWSDGTTACAAQGSSFAVPANGWENSLLRAAAGNATVWLEYSDATGTGNWVS